MKKLFQTLAIIFVLALATSAWSAGTIKTLQLKVYNATTAYTAWDQAAAGVTTVASGTSECTHTGGPGQEDAIPNTTDSRTLDLNKLLDKGDVLDRITFLTTGVTLIRSIHATTTQAGYWGWGIKFSPIDSATEWTNARVYHAGPMRADAETKVGVAGQGGVTLYTTESGESLYAHGAAGLLFPPGVNTAGGVSQFVIDPIQVQRYARPVFVSGATALRNPEGWMSLIPK